MTWRDEEKLQLWPTKVKPEARNTNTYMHKWRKINTHIRCYKNKHKTFKWKHINVCICYKLFLPANPHVKFFYIKKNLIQLELILVDFPFSVILHNVSLMIAKRLNRGRELACLANIRSSKYLTKELKIILQKGVWNNCVLQI